MSMSSFPRPGGRDARRGFGSAAAPGLAGVAVVVVAVGVAGGYVVAPVAAVVLAIALVVVAPQFVAAWAVRPLLGWLSWAWAAASRGSRSRGLGATPVFLPPQDKRMGLKVVMVSDTHGRHWDVDVPDGDVLVHAGDYTFYGRKDDAVDFNAWLAQLPHKHKVVVQGNHEHNAEWAKDAPNLLSHAHLLRDEAVTLHVGPGEKPLRIYGTNFFWPMTTRNPHYDLIPAHDVDVLVCHGPCKGYVDGGSGCQTMLQTVQRVQPRLVVSGHIHHAHGMAVGPAGSREAGIKFVNAANVNKGRKIGHPAVTVTL